MIKKDDNGNIILTDESKKLVIINDGETNGFIRHAVGIKRHTKWLVGELDGVRVYVTDNGIVLTKQDINP